MLRDSNILHAVDITVFSKEKIKLRHPILGVLIYTDGKLTPYGAALLLVTLLLVQT